MAYFPDLSPHTYTPTCGLEIVNIGWLDEGNEFPTGPTSPEFQAALLEFCHCPAFLHRGAHSCWFCRAINMNKEGNGQIRVPGRRGIWYAAPTLVHHYVVCHEYLPPEEFLEAVMPTAIDVGQPNTPPLQIGACEGFFRKHHGMPENFPYAGAAAFQPNIHAAKGIGIQRVYKRG